MADKIVKRPFIRHDQGFTLIESLIATLIFSLLLGIATWGYSQYLKVWQEDRFTGMPEMETYRKVTLMRRSLESLFDYYVKDSDSSFLVPFFEGGKSRFLFVTRSPALVDSETALAQVSFRPDEGSYKLIYGEESLRGTYLRQKREELAQAKEMVVLNDIEKYDIAYFGPESPELKSFKWSEGFSAGNRAIMPTKVDLQVKVGGKEYRYMYHTGSGTAKKGFEFNAEKLMR